MRECSQDLRMMFPTRSQHSLYVSFPILSEPGVVPDDFLSVSVISNSDKGLLSILLCSLVICGAWKLLKKLLLFGVDLMS